MIRMRIRDTSLNQEQVLNVTHGYPSHGTKVTERIFTQFFHSAGRFLRLNSQDIALY